MAGIGSYYFVGSAGGFIGSDGLDNLDFTIEVWHSSRMALVAKYNTYNYRPLSLSLNRFIPCGPNDPNTERTAMILFASNLFQSCPSFNKVVEECEGVECIDFDTGFNVPKHFDDLLQESKTIDLTDKINVYCAVLQPVKL